MQEPQTHGKVLLGSPSHNHLIKSPATEQKIKTIAKIANDENYSNVKNSLYECQLDDQILENEDSDEYEYKSDGDEIPNTQLISPHITRNSLKRVRRE
ncbi:MAG: hypothetical protein EZS28_053514 [Streblomastix strix]|uniref:Uncharacterized protein n=1 Tax=Streblomastix strix TaxID=222440 RepID=A0A5J4R8B2_9EUKA|nr:MAG: hypothetical protein EZS28_053514 [Streblomastix strix]